MRKLQVLRLFSGRTFFEFMHERVNLPKGAAPGDEPPDILVLPLEKGDLDFSDPRYAVPEGLAARAAARKMAVVLDCSGEGVVHTPARSEQIHRYLAGQGLPPDVCVYVTQDRNYGEAYAGWARAAAQPDAMAVANYDYFIRRAFYLNPNRGSKLFHRRLHAFRQRAAVRERRFVCLNFAPRWNKVLLLLWLMERGLWEEGFISFGGFGLRSDREAKRRKVISEALASDAFRDLAERLEPQVRRLDAYGQVLFGDVGRAEKGPWQIRSPVFGEGLADEHDRSWFTVVTETELSGPRRITEKPFKALLGFHPAIVLGNQGALSMIRDLGFRTFPGYFDEGYDAEPDPRRRFELVAEEIARLCRLDQAALRRMEQEVSETLIHNARWGLTELPAVYRERIDPLLIKQIMTVLKGGRLAA